MRGKSVRLEVQVVGGVDPDCGRHQSPDAKEASLERVDCAGRALAIITELIWRGQIVA